MFTYSLIFATLALFCQSDAQVGLNVDFKYQRIPLDPYKAMARIKQLLPQLNHTKMFDYDATVVRAMQASGIRNIMVGIPNLELQRCATGGDPLVPSILQGLRWLYNDGVQLTIAVGNEPTLSQYGTTYSQWLYPALVNFRSVLSKLGMNSVRLTVPFDNSGTMGNSYPPSQGRLLQRTKSATLAVARFLKNDGSPFTITLYPWYAMVGDPKDVSLQYAKLQTNLTASDGITYPNMLMAMYASVRAALLFEDPTLTEATLPIIVGETGWPTGGYSSWSPMASVSNAQTYVNNALVSGIKSMYLFEACDELQKGGDGYWGWMNEAGIPKYPIQWPRS